MNQTQMRCSQCGSQVKDSANADKLECPFCQATTLLVPNESTPGKPRNLKRDKKVDLSKFAIEVDGPDLELSWKWNRYKALSTIPIAGLICWHSSYFLSLGSWSEFNQFQFADLFSLFASVAVVCVVFSTIYTSVAFLFNKTKISVQSGKLISAHGPVPYFPAQSVSLTELQEIKVHRKVTKDSEGKTEVEFELHAVTESGRTIKLIKREKKSLIPAAVKSVLDSHIQHLSQFSKRSLSQSEKSSKSRKTPTRTKILLICPSCGTLIPPPRKLTSSKCRSCAAEITIPDDVWNSIGLHPPSRRNFEHEPITFVLRHDGPTLTITADWDREWTRRVVSVSALFFGSALFGLFKIFQYDNWDLLVVLDGGTFFLTLASVFVGVVSSTIGYIGMCQMLNRTVVKLEGLQISVWHGPLPIKSNSSLATTKINQISIHPNTQRYRNHRTFDLEAISDYGGTLELFFDQSELKGLQTLERLIEARLGLADRMVQGELK